MDEIPVAALAPLVVLALGWIGWCWWDIAHHPVRHLPKWAWALVCVVSIPLGGVVYLLVGRAPR
jgi:hypothetical protein